MQRGEIKKQEFVRNILVVVMALSGILLDYSLPQWPQTQANKYVASPAIRRKWKNAARNLSDSIR